METLAPPPDLPATFLRARVHTRVRYAETDRFGIAHHSSYVPWFEVGRVELLRLLGHDYDAFETAGWAFPLTEMHFRFDAPSRLDEPLVIETAILKVLRFRLTFAARILGEDETLRARAYSVHALVDRDMKVAEIPDELLELLEPRAAPADWLGRRFGPKR